jgi:hypothetical protein
MKKIIVEVKDDTKAAMVESIDIHHLSDLGEGVKDVVEDFVKANGGAVLPPVSITAVEQTESGRRTRSEEG